ncbi:hypothetical protein Tco_0050650, partial [Tanacetum coccineum]
MAISENFFSYGARLRLRFHFHVEKRLGFLRGVDRKELGGKSSNESGAKFIPHFDGSFIEFIQPCFCFT